MSKAEAKMRLTPDKAEAKIGKKHSGFGLASDKSKVRDGWMKGQALHPGRGGGGRRGTGE